MPRNKTLPILYILDQFINKRIEFLELISDHKPSITETIPKAQVQPIPKSCLSISGYSLYSLFLWAWI